MGQDGFRSGMKRLAELDRWLRDITADLGLNAGSLSRIACQYLPNWGVDISKNNIKSVKRRSKKSYFDEWEGGSGKTNRAIETATISVVPHGNQDLDDMVAAEADSIMSAKLEQGARFSKNRPFRIAEVGTGTGDTIIALLDRMSDDPALRKLASCCTFYLIEPSMQRLAKAQKRLRRHELAPKSDSYTLVRSDLCGHIPLLKDSMFDMILSNAVFHHISFPDYLTHLNNSLAEEGVMVTGDWFTTLFESPTYALSVLHVLGAPTEKIELFQSVFGIREDEKARYDAKLTPEQRDANALVVKYIGALAKETKGFKKSSRIYFLEAFESLKDRLDKMESAGFVTDSEELRANYRGFLHLERSVRKVFPPMELACIISAAKRKPGQTRLVPAGRK